MSDSQLSDSLDPVTSSPPRSSNFYLMVFGCIMLVGLLCLAWLGRPPRASAVGELLPQLDLQPLVNVEQEVDNEDLLGKFVVLHFWGTWCPPCKLEFPEFVELADQFHVNDQVAVISVSCSGGPEYDLDALKQKTIQFLNEIDSEIPTYSDSAAMTRQQLALLSPNGSFVYPTTLLVGRDGRIIESIGGYRAGEMEKLVEKIKSRL